MPTMIQRLPGTMPDGAHEGGQELQGLGADDHMPLGEAVRHPARRGGEER